MRVALATLLLAGCAMVAPPAHAPVPVLAPTAGLTGAALFRAEWALAEGALQAGDAAAAEPHVHAMAAAAGETARWADLAAACDRLRSATPPPALDSWIAWYRAVADARSGKAEDGPLARLRASPEVVRRAGEVRVGDGGAFFRLLGTEVRWVAGEEGRAVHTIRAIDLPSAWPLTEGREWGTWFDWMGGGIAGEAAAEVWVLLPEGVTISTQPDQPEQTIDGGWVRFACTKIEAGTVVEAAILAPPQ